MANVLNTRKNTGGPVTVLFLGSRTGSLFRLPFLADLLKEFSNGDVLNMTPVERFRECYQILDNFKQQNQDSDIHFIILKALQEKRIEVADICVVELMKKGIFDSIVTTNIGSELEDAFIESGMKLHRDFEVIIPGTAHPISEEMMRDHRFKIIKASGDVGSERYSICGYNINSKDKYLGKYPEIKNSIGQFNRKNMLMVGFDYKWDRHIIHAIFPRKEGSLWYVNEEQTKEDSMLLSYLEEYEAKRLEDTTSGYESFFEKLCGYILGFIPTASTNLMTLDKVTSKDKAPNETRNTLYSFQDEVNRLAETVTKVLQSQESIQKTQHKLQKELGHLTETVTKLLQSQEAMMDIKEDIKAEIKGLLDTLVAEPATPHTPPSYPSNSSSATPVSMQKSKQQSTRKVKPFEEKGK